MHLRADGQGPPTLLEVSTVARRSTRGRERRAELRRPRACRRCPRTTCLWKVPDVSESCVKRGRVLTADLAHRAVIPYSKFRGPRTKTKRHGRSRISHQFAEGLRSPLDPMGPQLTDLTSLTTQPRAVWEPQGQAWGDRDRVTAQSSGRLGQVPPSSETSAS